MAIDPDVLEQAREALRDAETIDATHIDLTVEEGRLVVIGEVASPEESLRAADLVGRFAEEVDNRLRVDPGLREATSVADAAPAGEPATPRAEEVLVGSADMLAGPEAEITSDVQQAHEENEPWDPPDEPHLAATAEDYAADASEGSDPMLEPADEDSPVDPAVAAHPDPSGPEELGETSGTESGAFLHHGHMSEARGATGEGTAGGGSLSGEPATETGATGADTAHADPARASTGGTGGGTGTARGPEADEDPAIREDLPSENPPDSPA